MRRSNTKIKAIWTTLKETKFKESPMRFPGLDGAKGLLVLMVYRPLNFWTKRG